MGVSQISAGSRTNPGGYTDDTVADMEQFQLGDHRTLDEVIRDVAQMGYIPSFCTACYRLGRTGADFMDLAKPGEIKHHCDPNALSTFLEYLEDYGSPETRRRGRAPDRRDARTDGASASARPRSGSSPRCAPASATAWSRDPDRRDRRGGGSSPRPAGRKQASQRRRKQTRKD